MLLTLPRRRIAASGFPIANSDLIRYYDADDLTAGAITSWAGHASVGPTVTPISASPTAVANVLNGRTVARFVNANSEALSAGDVGASLSGSVQYTAVAVYKAASGANRHVGGLGSGGGCARMFCGGFGGDHRLFVNEAGDWGRTSNLGDDQWVRLIWRYLGAGASDAARLRCRANGTDQALTFSGPIPSSIATSNGTKIGLGSSYFQGDLAFWAIASICISDATADAVDTWLSTRFGF